MLKPRNHNEERKKSENKFAKALMTGAALGVGLKAAHSYIGEKALSDVVDGASSALKALSPELEDLKFKDINATKTKELLSTVKESYIEGKNNPLIDNDLTSQTNLIDHIVKTMDIITASKDTMFGEFNNFLYQQYTIDKVISPVIEDSIGSNKDLQEDSILRKKFTDFVQQAARNIHDDFHIKETYEDNIGDYRDTIDADFIDKVVENLRNNERLRKIDIKEYKNEFLGAQDDLIKIMTDIDLLSENFGEDNKKANFFDKVLGDNAVKVKDILSDDFEAEFKHDYHILKEDERGFKNKEVVNIKTILNEFRDILSDEDKDKFDSLYIDYETIRKDAENNIYSRKTSKELGENLLGKISETSIGTLLKTNDILSSKKSPNLHFTEKLTTDFTLSLSNEMEGLGSRLDSSYVKLFDETYRITKDGLEQVEELSGAKLVHKSSAQYKMINQVAGNRTQGAKHSNKYLRWLDIGQDGRENIVTRKIFGDERAKGQRGIDIKEQFKENKRLILSNEDMTDKEVAQIIDNYKDINKFFEQNTRPVKKSTAQKLMEATKHKSVQRTFEHATLDAEELIDIYSSKESSSLASAGRYHNSDLKNLISRYMRDPAKALSYDYVKTVDGQKVTYSFEDILRREVIKEGILQEINLSEDINAATGLIKKSGISGDELKEINKTAAWGVMQWTTGGFNNYKALKNVNNARDIIETSNSVLYGPEKIDDKETVTKTINNALNEVLNTKQQVSYKDTRQGKDIIKHYNQNEWAYVKKGFTPADFIEHLNDETKRKALFTQFVAGSKDFSEDVTAATLGPYFFANRINEGLGRVGLGLSSESMSSTPRAYASLITKRVLPAFIGVSYLSYADDMAKEITGTSFRGAAVNTMASIDLGARRVADTIGVSSKIDAAKKTNPLLEYWTGSKDFQGYEERNQWYQDGYSAVRRGRFWSFGSTNEFRGSNIAYYQPNYLRRAHSDWNDKLLYDSTHEKWSKHIVPTPTAPLSTLSFLADPYWLEEKHKEDMPYPMTAPLFEENTPWGVLLNPTVGRLIKPQRRMHTDRLGDKMIDVKALIEMRNRETLQKARDRNAANVMAVKEGHITPQDYVSTYAPTLSERSLTITSGQDIGAVGPGFGDNEGYLTSSYPVEFEGQRGQIGYYPLADYQDAIDIKDYIKDFDYYTGIDRPESEGYNPIHNAAGLGDIAHINQGIKDKAAVNPYTLMADSISSTPAKYGNDLLSDPSVIPDLQNIDTNKQHIENIMYSTQKMTGLYGFAASAIMSDSSNVSYRLANAGAMTSASKRLWDQSLGGLGGQSGNMLLKFLPSSNRRVKEINPLMNTMPDWLPDKFRMGNPYDALPKGGMRLPGRGYESLNELHPDEFGIYGAFDRYKILADVAPYSQEYRAWKDIAGKTVDDPSLQKEMKEISNRVAEQSKKHDFYDYKFKGRDIDNRKAVLEETYGNNYFKVVGDDTVYRMAGLSVMADGNALEEYMRPGMEIQLLTDKNQAYAKNDDRYDSTSASVIIGNKNINRALLDSGVADERRDTSAAATVGLYDGSEVTKGRLMEAISHADIPIIHDKFMRIETPLESFKRHNVYGTESQSWTNPIQSYIMPTLRRGSSSSANVALGTIAFGLSIAARDAEVPKEIQRAADVAMLLTNRGSMMGAVGVGLMKFSVNDLKKGELNSLARAGAYIGGATQIASYIWSRRDNPLHHTLNMGMVGAGIFSKFHDSEILQNFVGDDDKAKMAIAGAAVGATVGAMTSGQRFGLLNKDTEGTYIPDNTKKRWQMEEYFDRLEYVKYTGLYNKAARKALIHERVNINKLIRLEEMREKQNAKTREQLDLEQERIKRSPISFAEKMKLLKTLDETRESLDAQFEIKGGKWARMALLYKDAADSTIYGMKDNASWSQMLRAIPKADRDYFMEFANEKDPKKRNEIMKYVSPYQRKALQIAWGEKVDELEDNATFFSKYRMPGSTWSGWRPDKDLSDIKIKTIENEGMMLSDFGEYDSSLSDPAVVNAEPINTRQEAQNQFVVKKNLLNALQGAGLQGVKIDMYPNSTGVIESVINITRTKQYDITQKVQGIFSRAI